jgi:hypothetical protein
MVKMASSHKSILLLVTLLVCLTIFIDNTEANCFSDWRCAKWLEWGRGKLWDDCNTKCKGDGYKGGSCVEVKTTCWWWTTIVLQCQCTK